MKSRIYLGLILVATTSLIFQSCSKETVTLSEGNWRGVFHTPDASVPFNFSVEDDTLGTVNIFLTNGKEKTILDSVRYERDSVIIPIEVYDAILIGKLEADKLNGYFRKNQSPKQGIPFNAVKGNDPRFGLTNGTTSANVSGTWSVVLTNEKDEPRYTVGLLEQSGTEVTGTIMSTTGDYRYLQGVVDGDSIKLSGFGGSNPSLLVGKLNDESHLVGEFISPGGKVKLAAVKSDTAKLPDAYSLTYLKKEYKKLSFTFPDVNGKPVSLEDDKYKGKVVIVTIQGTWCPNCVDEAAFLSPWYKQNKDRGVEIIALSFERKDDPEFAKERISKFIKRFDVDYDILFAGIADKKIVAEKLPQLNTFLSFPTTLFIDKEGKVRKVHTGYTGPATGKYYEDFIKEFNTEVDALVKENIVPIKPS